MMFDFLSLPFEQFHRCPPWEQLSLSPGKVFRRFLGTGGNMSVSHGPHDRSVNLSAEKEMRLPNILRFRNLSIWLGFL